MNIFVYTSITTDYLASVCSGFFFSRNAAIFPTFASVISALSCAPRVIRVKVINEKHPRVPDGESFYKPNDFPCEYAPRLHIRINERMQHNNICTCMKKKPKLGILK